MYSRWFTAVALLAAGFGSGFLVRFWSARTENVAKDFVIRDGPVLHLENRSKKDQYLIVARRKSGATDDHESYLTATGQTTSISRKNLDWLYVYRLQQVAYVIGEGVPCLCTVPPPPVPPPPPPYSNLPPLSRE